MAATLWKAATSNGFSTTLNGSISDTDESITLTTVTGLQAPGVLVIDRTDSTGTATPDLREYITFTGISTNTLTGCTRGVAGSAAQSHASGAIVEENMSVTHLNDLEDFLLVSHDASGNIVANTATIQTLRISTHLNISDASITGAFPLHPVWVISGLVSGATSNVGIPLPVPQSGALSFLSARSRTAPSGASLIIDINKNGSTIFTNQDTRLSISAGSLFASTASIGDPGVSSGDYLSVDIDGGTGLLVNDITVLGRIA